MERVNISFDEEHNIRLLEPDKYTDSERLQKESSAFVTKVQDFSTTVQTLVELLSSHVTKIEAQKLRAIGQKNLVEGELENRKRKQIELQALINEKLAELDRVTKQLESMERTEQEQLLQIEKLSNNEV